MFEELRESESVELKKAKAKVPASFWETYSSFANTSGGTIYLGINEKKPNNEIIGVENALQMVKDIFDTANNPAKVSRNLLKSDSVKVETIDGRDIIVVTVPECPKDEKPIYLNGNPALCYRRDGMVDHQMSFREALGLFYYSARIEEDFTFPLSHTSLPSDTAIMRYAVCFFPPSQFHIRRGFFMSMPIGFTRYSVFKFIAFILFLLKFRRLYACTF